MLVILSAAILLNGCAGLIKSDIAVFHVLPDTPQPTSYAFIPLKDQEGSLEYETYKGLIRTELTKYQYTEVPIERAEVVVAFGYGIDTGKDKISSIPQYGQTGVSSSTTYGTISTYGNYGTYSGATIYTPTFGVTGYQTVSQTQYTRQVWLHIVDNESLRRGKVKKVYEANVVSRGSSSQIAKVMPALIKAIFKKFPGKSGSTRREIVPLELR